MSKVLRYFLFSSLVLSVLFLASCEDDGEGPVDPSSINLEQNGSVVDTISGLLPGDQVTVDVQVEFGSDSPEVLRVFDDNGDQIGSDYPISSSTNFPLQINFDVPDDATGEYIVTFETFDGDDASIASEDLVLEVYGTVVDIATLNDGFEILTAALEETGLTGTLTGDGPFTVFAPTDAAFAAMGIESAEDLPEGDALTQLLSYHVISGQALAAEDLMSQSYETVEGSEINVEVGDEVVINDSVTVTMADLMAGNGVVHVIDAVLMPGASILYDEAVLLGGQLNPDLGSFYNVLDSTVYNSSDANANNAMIDLIYWYTETSESIIGAPDNQFAIDAFPNTTLGDNATRFIVLDGVSEEDFDGVSSAEDLDAIYGSDTQTPESRLVGLQEGQVFGFQLDPDRGGNVGLVKVMEISGETGAERQITIAIKTRNE